MEQEIRLQIEAIVDALTRNPQLVVCGSFASDRAALRALEHERRIKIIARRPNGDFVVARWEETLV